MLEILVALSIVAIVFISIFKLHAQTLDMSGRVDFDTTAPLLAESKLSEFEAKPADELGDDTGDFGEKFVHYGWQVTVTDVEAEMLGELAQDLKGIEVRISFREDERVYRLRTYRFVRR